MIAPRHAHAADVARAALGLVGLLRPQWLLVATGSADGTWPRRAARLLGARYLVQASAGTVLARSWVPEADVAVDLVHAASMAGLARAFPHHRRLALASGALALVFAAVDLAAVRGIGEEGGR
ncbi:hypothetical protein [Nocardioides zeicaulis]|uniref:Uncharacterized protein n=1 Tax=Nocardioides zeicaulis TaxID=1776857 RepID=A0ABV6DWH1_9ACTN